MLESVLFPVRTDTGTARTAERDAKPQAVFRMAQDSEGRIDGSVPVWDYAPRGTDRVTGAVEQASRQNTGRFAANSPSAYAENGAVGSSAPAVQPFGFGDILDMINPLQHIPLVNNVYRYMTGDTISAASQVVGDCVYGGPLGGAIAVSNVIVKQETGRDIAGNLMAFAFNDTPLPATPDPGATALASADMGAALNGLVPAAGEANNLPVPKTGMVLAAASFSAFDIY